MSILSKLRRLVAMIFSVKDIESALNVMPIVSQDQLNQIQEWVNCYNGYAEWNKPSVPSLNIAYSICAEISRNVVSEFDTEILGNDQMNEWYQTAVVDELGNIIERMGASGEVIMRPFVTKDRISIYPAMAGSYFPVRYSMDGVLESVVFVQRQQEGVYFYTLLTHCDWQAIEDSEFGEYTIDNIAYKSSQKDMLGSPTSFSDVEAWAELESSHTFITSMPWFVPITAPNSEAVFHRAMELIRLADELDAMTTREFSNARSRVIMDKFMLDVGDGGSITDRDKDIYVGVDDENIKPIIFNPEIRIKAYEERMQGLLRRIETSVGLSFGILSEPDRAERTATEIKHGRQRFFVLVDSLKRQTEKSLKKLVVIMSEMANVYELNGTYSDVIFNIGDSILRTSQEELDEIDRTTNALLRLKAKGEAPEGLAFAYMLSQNSKVNNINKEMILEAKKRIDEHKPDDETLKDDKTDVDTENEIYNQGYA